MAEELRVDFHALLLGAEHERSKQRVPVEALGKNVEFYVSNSIKAGQRVRVELSNAKVGSIVFKAVSVQRVPAMQTNAAAADIQALKETMQAYKPNWVVNFLNSRRYGAIFTVYPLAIGAFLVEGDWYMASVVAGGLAPIFVPLLLLKIFYPKHHLMKYWKKNGIDQAIKKDSGTMSVAICAYNSRPGKRTLRCIKALNPAAGKLIEEKLS